MKPLSLNQPHAIIMVGMTGSGKSTFAAQFAHTFNAPLIDAGYLTEHSRDVRSASHLAINIIDQLSKTKQLFIVDGFSDTAKDRTLLYEKLRQNGYIPFVVWVQTDPVSVRARLAKAGYSDEDADAAIKHHKAPHAREVNVVISGRHTYSTQARSVLRKLSQPRVEAAKAHQPVTPERPEAPEQRQRRVLIR